jgi:RNA polymerase sigma factor (sigma-70 family)
LWLSEIETGSKQNQAFQVRCDAWRIDPDAARNRVGFQPAAAIYSLKMDTNDRNLLRQYIERHSQEAFAALVSRHVNLVYSVALRLVRSPQLAEEVSQSVFTDLARQAQRLVPDTILTAWLYQVARRTAIDVIRHESRRQLREQLAYELTAMNANAADWTHLEPLLDEAMHALGDTDRVVVLLCLSDSDYFASCLDRYSLKATDNFTRKCCLSLDGGCYVVAIVLTLGP